MFRKYYIFKYITTNRKRVTISRINGKHFKQNNISLPEKSRCNTNINSIKLCKQN